MNKKNDQQQPNKGLKENANDLGVDQDEQAMNGLYGMVETEYEDSLHDSEK